MGLSFAISACSKDEPTINEEFGEEIFEEVEQAPAKEYFDQLSRWTYNSAIMEVDSLSVDPSIFLKYYLPPLTYEEELYELDEDGYLIHSPFSNDGFQTMWKKKCAKTDVVSFNLTEERENLHIAAVYSAQTCDMFWSDRGFNKYCERFDDNRTSWTYEDLATINLNSKKNITVNLTHTEDPDYHRVYIFFLEADPYSGRMGSRIPSCPLYLWSMPKYNLVRSLNI